MADALSRISHELSSLTLTVDLKERIVQNSITDPWFLNVRSIIESGSILEGRYEGYSINLGGLLIFRGRAYILEVGELWNLVLSEAHKAPYSAHPGVKKMNVDLKQHYYWLGMKRDIADFVA